MIEEDFKKKFKRVSLRETESGVSVSAMINRSTVFAIALLCSSFANGSIEVKSEEDLYQFYNDWAKSDNVEIFREKQRQYTMQLMNSSVDPCDDFYEFACGNFKSIVPENNTWERTSVLKLIHYSQSYLQPKLLEEEVDPLEEEVFQKMKIFYRSCLDNSTRRIDDLTNFVKNFAAWPILQETVSSGEFDWLNVTAHAARYKVFPMFRVKVDRPEDPRARYHPRFYNKNDDTFALEYFKKIAESLNIDLTDKDADLMEVDRFVDKIQNLQDEWRLLGKHEEFKLSDLPEKLPEIDFRRYLKIFRGVNRVSPNEIVVLEEPIYFEDLSNIISQTDPKVIANYVFTRFVENAWQLVDLFTEDSITEQCRRVVQETMKPAFLGLFSKQYYDEETHTQIKNIVEELQAGGRKVINDSEWITPETKAKALEKINVVKKNVGLPDYYRNPAFLTGQYKNLKIDRNSFYHNLLNAIQVGFITSELTEDRLAKEFYTDPLMVNAGFSAALGALELPAAILQPPLFHKYSAKYVNYGGAGAVVGHELMHGFDNDGILFDEKGEVGIWWDPRISSTYYTRAECYYKQYDQFKVDSINKTVDGESTLGENVADNEGLRIALNAYKRWLEANEETSNIEYNGELLTPAQSFYLAFAQLYCSAFTENELQRQLRADVHSPNFVRVMGTLSNSPEFAEAYKCPVGSKMNPEQKCKYLRK